MVRGTGVQAQNVWCFMCLSLNKNGKEKCVVLGFGFKDLMAETWMHPSKCFIRCEMLLVSTCLIQDGAHKLIGC